MKKIKLSQGKFALVDDNDFEILNKSRWHVVFDKRHWYARGSQKGGHVYMHRVILDVNGDLKVDHIDGDGLNNLRSNLRVATQAENLRNRGKNKNNTSGYKGVTKFGGKYMASIRVDGIKKNLGLFIDAVEAAKAYDRAAIKLHGRFAWTNFKEKQNDL